MWRSCLLINVGDNPDRPRPGRTWLRNLYHVHQRLWMAFPSNAQNDPQFLKPFNPRDFDAKQVKAKRDAETGFLFRIDPHPGGRVVIVVQSAAQPQWKYAFQNADFLLLDFLAAPPHAEEFDPSYHDGQQFRFRIRVALTNKKKTSTDGHDLRKYREAKDRYGRQKSQSKRVALSWEVKQDPQDVIRDWFSQKGKAGGFVVEVKDFRALQIGWGNGFRPGRKKTAEDGDDAGHHMRFRSALLEGTLRVTNADLFRNTIARGIGSGKAFGFGLLSVAPCAAAS
jgi:CRISPR system Cascade subunit CasE